VSRRARVALLFTAVASAGAPLAAQQTVTVRLAGGGPVGARLATALSTSHHLIRPDSQPALLPRDSAYDATVIVLGRNAIIEARVHGDVFVVGGDAFIHPGANVDGRVVAIGGGVYESMLAIVRQGVESHRDFTFDVIRIPGGFALDYRAVRESPSQVVSLPGAYGVRIPTYDRSNGLSLAFSPLVSLDTGRYELEPAITYRSDIGAVDPSLRGTLALGRATRALVFVGRGTFTNDSWIWSDLVNSASSLGLGLDTRNYYRSDRVEATVHRLWLGTTTEFEPFVGARAERDRPVGPDSAAAGGPWSLFGHGSYERIRRPNPPATRGTLQSALLGAHWSWEAQRVRTMIDLTNEAATFSIGERRFVQSTIDGQVRFPTFGAQLFWLSLHAVHTFGDTAPPQRWSYLGGAGTISTLELLQMGGDRLFFVESNYFIPIERFDFRILGSPSVTLRHIMGSAGVGKLPSLEQNIALRLGLSFARAEIVVDPVRRDVNFGFGLSFTR